VAAGELAFDNGEDGLDQCASTVEAAWRVVAHLRTYPAQSLSIHARWGTGWQTAIFCGRDDIGSLSYVTAEFTTFTWKRRLHVGGRYEPWHPE